MENNTKTSILVVDDNSTNLQVLGIILQEAGYKVSLAMNGIQALDYAKKKFPDLILLDMMMPEMDGLEACKHLKKDDATRNIPIIFITALVDSESIVNGLNAGAVDYITKPFVKEEVLARINVHIKLRKAMTKLEEMSVTDEMTGIYNRRFAYHILSQQIKLAKREKDSFSVGFVDIDNLKIVNDTYGHAAGDRLIKTVVESLRHEVRESDYIFRMGGDEFLILFPRATQIEADNVIQRIKHKLKEQEVEEAPIEFCCGFSEYHPDSEMTVDDLITKADSCMYQEKMKKKKEKI